MQKTLPKVTIRAYIDRMTTMKTNPNLIRLSVNLSQETAAALRVFADRRGLSFTESIRRCISIAKWIQDEADSGRTVYSADPDQKNARELVLL